MKVFINLLTSVTFYEFLISIIAIIIGIYSTNYSIKHADLERCIADLSDAKFVNDSYILLKAILSMPKNIKYQYPDIVYLYRCVKDRYREVNFYLHDVNIYLSFLHQKSKLKYKGCVLDDLNKLCTFYEAIMSVKENLRTNDKRNNNKYIRQLLSEYIIDNHVMKKTYGIDSVKKCLSKFNSDLNNYRNEFKHIHEKCLVGQYEKLFKLLHKHK